LENCCPSTWRTAVRPLGEFLSAHEEFLLSVDRRRLARPAVDIDGDVGRPPRRRVAALDQSPEVLGSRTVFFNEHESHGTASGDEDRIVEKPLQGDEW
jgi:hypothetical protein